MQFPTMEDDIDIEEHDVLDNPKIRDIFPDLSLVKIEVPDEEIQDPDLYEDYTPELRYDECDIKEENLSDDENNYEQNNTNNYEQNDLISQYEQSEASNFDQNEQSVYQVHEDISENHEQNENVYQDLSEDIGQNEQIDAPTQFNNKIILGTKKIDYDILYEEALNSNTKVQLENWEFKLQTSPCFCNTCEILFPTVNALDAHNSVSHSLLVALDIKTNTARKSTVSTKPSTYCNHCDKTFPDDTALISHLYQLLPLSNYKKTPPAPVKVENFLYKCVKCVKYFDTYANASRHKKRAHPDLVNANTIVRISKGFNDNIKLSTSILEKKYGKFFASSNLVPKSVLFQCNVCHVGFVSCYSALQHSRKCESKTAYNTCKVCKRKIRTKDEYVHGLQHKDTDKLKIYTLNKRIHEKVLLKCPKCLICYDEKTFWLHEKTCQGTQSSYLRCNICSINIINTRYEYHKNCHDSMRYSKKSFIIVEFSDKNDINLRSMKKDAGARPTESDAALYYCSCCGSYKTNSTIHGHANGTCKQIRLQFCEICGLGFSRQFIHGHKLLHTKKKMCLNDFKIFSLETGEPIDTPMSKFHYCRDCNIHFLTREAVLSHRCEVEKYELCEICNKKFSLKAYKPHSGFHSLDLPELIKKYNSMNNMWNVIYSCEDCGVVTMSYDSAVEHSQAHINDIVFPSSNSCKICNFNILEKDLKAHMNLHENNDSLNRNEFTILKYSYKNLYNSEWMSIMAPLPKQHKYLILSKSIYRYTRRFKLNCDIDCKTDDVKLFCKKCKKAVNMQEMKKHYVSTCKYSSKYICSTCELKFKNLDDCILHESEHESGPKMYKVLTYNDEKDEIFNQKLTDFEASTNSQTKPTKLDSIKPKFSTKSKTKMSAVKSENMKYASKIKLKNPGVVRTKVGCKYFNKVKATLEKANRFKLYKCEVCNSCLTVRKNVTKHKCMFGVRRKSKCSICKEHFYARHLHHHMSWHKMYPKLNKKPLIVYFNPKKSLSNVATIYQCKCGLNFTTKQSADTHINICDDNLNISKENCSKCNMLFPTDVLVSHLCKHHSKPVDIKIEKVERIDSIFTDYKCAKCKVIYSRIDRFEEHLFTCPVKYGKKCSECQSIVDNKTFPEHKCKKNITIIKYNGIASTLFRCPTCDICYLFRKSFNYHLDVKHVNKRQVITCNICRLRFTGQVVNKHNSLFHSADENFIIKLFEPETGKFTISRGRNYKLDLKPLVKNTETSNTFNKTTQKVVPKKQIAPKEVVAVTPSADMSTEAGISYGRVWKCTSCDICYLDKKTWHYHMKVINHKMKYKREIVPCDVCGLRFVVMFLAKHKHVHETGESYIIEVMDPETNKICTVSGRNIKTYKSKKRNLNSVENPIKTKRSRTESANQEPNTSKLNFADNTSTRRSKRNNTFADDEQNTPKIDFEIVDMDERTSMLSDVDTTDPLNNLTESLTDNSVAGKEVISKKLRNMLNAKFDVYSNSLFKCVKCSLHFMTKKSLFGHVSRDCGRSSLARHKCDECNHEFTWKTLLRHKYVHHIKMDLKPELLNIEIVTDEVKLNTSQRKTANDISISETTKINYYKCADCNVCFIDENSCRRHCASHVPLDPKDYIECKICNFQFLIEFLKNHVHIHHNAEFFIEDLTITEYKATDSRSPKVVVYRGIDKVQSRLISTTTDSQVDNSDACGDILGT